MDFYGFLMDFYELFYGFLMDFYGLLMDFYGLLMDFYGFWLFSMDFWLISNDCWWISMDLWWLWIDVYGYLFLISMDFEVYVWLAHQWNVSLGLMNVMVLTCNYSHVIFHAAGDILQFFMAYWYGVWISFGWRLLWLFEFVTPSSLNLDPGPKCLQHYPESEVRRVRGVIQIFAVDFCWLIDPHMFTGQGGRMDRMPSLVFKVLNWLHKTHVLVYQTYGCRL